MFIARLRASDVPFRLTMKQDVTYVVLEMEHKPLWLPIQKEVDEICREVHGKIHAGATNDTEAFVREVFGALWPVDLQGSGAKCSCIHGGKTSRYARGHQGISRHGSMEARGAQDFVEGSVEAVGNDVEHGRRRSEMTVKHERLASGVHGEG